MTDNTPSLDEVVRLVRSAGVTGAMRAILESLADGGEQAVPQIARARQASRQHVQATAGPLVKEDLAEFCANPAHRRSPLLDLTDQGQCVMAAITRSEAQVLSHNSIDVAEAEVRATIRTLIRLAEAMAVPHAVAH